MLIVLMLMYPLVLVVLVVLVLVYPLILVVFL